MNRAAVPNYKSLRKKAAINSEKLQKPIMEHKIPSFSVFAKLSHCSRLSILNQGDVMDLPMITFRENSK